MRVKLNVLCGAMLWTSLAMAQVKPQPAVSAEIDYLKPQAGSLPAPSGFKDYIRDGKLQLSLEDAIRLMLMNNTDVRIAHASVDQARYDVLGSHRAFDPTLTSSASDTRSLSPATNQLQGVEQQTLSTLTQQAQVGLSQTVPTGANYNISFGGGKSDTNSSFFFLNPYLTSSLNFQVTQPLLRNRGLFPNRAPIVIARRNLDQSQASFEAQVNDLVQRTVSSYWQVVGAREQLTVVQSSLDAAQATYNQNKRALELGALPPLDIYRSESQVAQRRVAAIQAEYSLKEAEDQFRQIVGADLDPYTRALDLELTEKPEPAGKLFSIDEATALEQALGHRPELEALRLTLENDDTNIRLAHNGLLPDLELSALYTSAGIGGNLLDTSVNPPIVTPGGLGDALSQTFRFRFPTYGATLSLTFPIRNRAAQAALGRASVTRRTDLYQMRREQQAITLEVANAVHQLEQAKLSLEASKVARDFAQKNVDAEQRKYELGAGQIFLVLEAQSELSQAESSVVEAEIGYQLALTAVQHSTGDLAAKHQVEMEQAQGGTP